MKRRQLLAATLTASTGVLAGCVDPGSSSTPTEDNGGEGGKLVITDADEDRESDEIKAYYDPESGMVCFTYRDGFNAAATGGMDCEHINETDYTPRDFR